VNFEDDMLIKGQHVQHFVAVSEELLRLREAAPDDHPEGTKKKDVVDAFSGPMTKGQLKRMIPGFIRVEVLLDEGTHGAQRTLDPVPVDLNFNGKDREVNPETCCHVSEKTAS
jgi:hypothetical protein